jgi:ABC-2 type transporter
LACPLCSRRSRVALEEEISHVGSDPGLIELEGLSETQRGAQRANDGEGQQLRWEVGAQRAFTLSALDEREHRFMHRPRRRRWGGGASIRRLVGLVVKDPETAQVMSTLTIIPFIFGSSAFVPVTTMPGWLQAFAANQPVSVVVNAVRALTQGGPVYHWLWLSAAWFGALLMVFVPLAVSRYRRV